MYVGRFGREHGVDDPAQVDVGLGKVMSNGAGFSHSSFCVVEIAKSKRNGNISE